MSHQFIPGQLYVEPEIANSVVCKNVLKNLKEANAKTQIYMLHNEKDGDSSCRRNAAAKTSLLLAANGTDWIVRCPGTTANYLCCNYQILNTGLNCGMSCSYCALQSYYKFPHLVQYCNTAMMSRILAKYLQTRRRPFLRIGTGEYTDSLFLDHLTEYSRILVSLFAKGSRCMLELKTKTDNVDNLLDLDPKGRTVVSWSMNSEEIATREEHGVATLDERLAAAKRCEAAGYLLGFHFDPIVPNQGWEEAYRRTVNRIFDSVRDPDHILWISLGVIRFPPKMKETFRNAHPKSEIPNLEYIQGNDGKMRLFKPQRIAVYAKMLEFIRNRHNKSVVYLCMESPSVWRSALGLDFTKDSQISDMLDASAKRKFRF